MDYFLYTVLDVVAESADQVFQAVNDGVAVRDVAEKAKTSHRCQDLRLYKIGKYNASTKKIEGMEPEMIWNGDDNG